MRPRANQAVITELEALEEEGADSVPFVFAISVGSAIAALAAFGLAFAA